MDTKPKKRTTMHSLKKIKMPKTSAGEDCKEGATGSAGASVALKKGQAKRSLNR